MADFADRSLGIGYAGGASILFLFLMAALGVWYWSAGSVSVDTVNFAEDRDVLLGRYSVFSNLGTALGDWMADTTGLGYERGALVFGAGLVVIAGAYFYTNVSRTLLFWSAFILTRPLGATVGDLLDKSLADGGMAFSRFYLGNSRGVYRRLHTAAAVEGWQASRREPNRGGNINVIEQLALSDQPCQKHLSRIEG